MKAFEFYELLAQQEALLGQHVSALASLKREQESEISLLMSMAAADIRELDMQEIAMKQRLSEVQAAALALGVAPVSSLDPPAMAGGAPDFAKATTTVGVLVSLSDQLGGWLTQQDQVRAKIVKLHEQQASERRADVGRRIRTLVTLLLMVVPIFMLVWFATLSDTRWIFVDVERSSNEDFANKLVLASAVALSLVSLVTRASAARAQGSRPRWPGVQIWIFWPLLAATFVATHIPDDLVNQNSFAIVFWGFVIGLLHWIANGAVVRGLLAVLRFSEHTGASSSKPALNARRTNSRES